ncbi:MAG TPA: CHAD domain-containing protein, partial [Polyangiaceae bacterium]|nr:CHAD domain-containing protein [Polyangiaceae bacterium]
LSPVEVQRSYARALLERLIRGAAEREQRAAGAELAEQLHRLRIDIKKVRYALELFEPLLGEHFQGLNQRATALQELLGAHHDLTVLGDIVAERASELAHKNRRTLSAGLRQAGAALAAEQQAVLARFQERGFDSSGWLDELQRALGPR